MGLFLKNSIGDRGEAFVNLVLKRPVDKKNFFNPKFLGDKAQLLDYVVNLTDGSEAEIGAFFFFQVKSTNTAADPSFISAPFSHEEVMKVQERKIPTYLVAVDVSDEDTEQAYIIAIDSQRKNGVARVPRIFNLNKKETKIMLYNEVKDYFTNQHYAFQFTTH